MAYDAKFKGTPRTQIVFFPTREWGVLGKIFHLLFEGSKLKFTIFLKFIQFLYLKFIFLSIFNSDWIINIENELIPYQESLHENFISFDLFTSKVLENISYFWLHYI